MSTHTEPTRRGAVAAPKGVSGRRVSRPMVAVLVAMSIASALLVALVVTRAHGGSQYLVAAKPIGFGQKVTAEDLVMVRGSLAEAARPLPADQRDKVVGRYAQVPLLQGQVLTAGDAFVDVFPESGKRMVSVALKAELAPAQPLRPGANVQLVEVPAGTPGGGRDGGDRPQVDMVPGTVVAVRSLDFGGGTTVDVIVGSDEAGRIAAAAAGNRIALVLDGGR
ncbi:hypothetical protein GCM10010124_25410 [Pilimelia terevasa]|uniref:SAF domain-containing protein n=1 Tax=Pilimelia terevasa TaxID=53372 RepID=A0A8J3FK40_9ACTN|nr:SAF domain-containing protein [Pilimelia terevasa]GGK31524.1 hypothetical protein GCM10010124_25410 [Pilimelia terevasa]